MKELLALIMTASLCTGCAALNNLNKRVDSYVSARQSGSNRVAPAIKKPVKAASSGAAKPSGNQRDVHRETDEALFRLALLSLKPAADPPATARGLRLLKRLKKEHPASSWTVHASRLIELINIAEDLKRQNKDLKAANQSLSSELSELNNSIEQLKHLDMEIEKNTR